MTAFFSAPGRTPYGVQRGFLGPTTKGWSFLSQSFTVITIETPGFARHATDGSGRSETRPHAGRTRANTARATKTLRIRPGDRIPPLSHLPAGGHLRGMRGTTPRGDAATFERHRNYESSRSAPDVVPDPGEEVGVHGNGTPRRVVVHHLGRFRLDENAAVPGIVQDVTEPEGAPV